MIDLEIPENEPFKDRTNRSFKLVAIIAIVLFLLGLISTNFYYALGVSIFFFVVQIFFARNENRFFITSIKILNNEVTLTYKDEETEKLFAAKLDSVTFKKRFLIKRSRAACLKIYNDGELLIKQHEIGEWKEKKFDEIVKTYKALRTGKNS